MDVMSTYVMSLKIIIKKNCELNKNKETHVVQEDWGRYRILLFSFYWSVDGMDS